MNAKIGEIVKEDFTVVDSGNNLVTGLLNANFTKRLYNPSGTEVSGSITVTITELGEGDYRATFTPNVIGTWYIIIIHTTYFPWGKADSVDVKNNDIDSVSNDVDNLSELTMRILGLSQENHYLDNTVYDEDSNMTSGRIRIYDDVTKVGTSDNVIATYIITAGYNNSLLRFYKVIKQ